MTEISEVKQKDKTSEKPQKQEKHKSKASDDIIFVGKN